MNTYLCWTPRFFKQRSWWQGRSFSHSSSRSHQPRGFLPLSPIHFQPTKKKPPSKSQPAFDPVSPLPLPPLAQATAMCLWGPCLSPRHPHPSPPTLSTAPTAILLRGESVHSTSQLGALRQEAHLSETVCSGRMLMPRPPLTPSPAPLCDSCLPCCSSNTPHQL